MSEGCMLVTNHLHLPRTTHVFSIRSHLGKSHSPRQTRVAGHPSRLTAYIFWSEEAEHQHSFDSLQ